MTVVSCVLLNIPSTSSTSVGRAEVSIEPRGVEPVRFPNGFHYSAARLKLGGGSLVKGCRYARDRIEFDANLDGRLDVILTCYYDSKIAILENDGSGGLLPPTFVST